MHKLTICLVMMLTGIGSVAMQSKSQSAAPAADMPSEKEFGELLAKADEKVSMFEAAIKDAKPHLDSVDPKYAKNYLDVASTAHSLISSTIKNGPSAYRLIGVLTTLDDLSLDAANGEAFLLAADENHVVKGASPDMGVQGAVIALSTAGAACNDISELIFHATMRFVAVEEAVLNDTLGKK